MPPRDESPMYPDAELPDTFRLPPLPAALDAWFAFGGERDDDTEVIAYGEGLDGAVLDDLGVVDAASARLALVGYRWVWEGGAWVDEAARGGWKENWIVLDSINADPIIADISTTGVSVLEARHGEGDWDPQLRAASLTDFIADLEVEHDAGPPPFDSEPHDAWSVWALDLGASPLSTLVAVAGYPLFPDFSRTELLALRRELPVRLVDDLTETAAEACVAFGARHGAVFEARTYLRASGVALDDLLVDDLLEDDDDTEPAPSDQLVESIEEELGFRLPDSYIALSRLRNGGRFLRGAHTTSEPTGWADDHIAVTALRAIGRTRPSSLIGELGSTFMRDEWGYPAWGVGIADTPTAGHEQVMLDYRACGPDGEPRVVYVDQERDFAVTEIAPDFATFLRGLVDEDDVDTSDPIAEKAAALEVAAHGSVSPLISRALAASPDLPDGERAVRELARRLIERHGFFTVRGDDDSRMLLDAMFLLHSRIAVADDLDDFLQPDGDTSYERPSLPLMLFFAIVDEPYDLRTGGYAPGFVEEWWSDRQRAGAFETRSEGVRFTAGTEAAVLRALREVAASGPS